MTKEDEILLAAEDEFFANGYDATSTAAIAKRAGVTHAMINYYFKNKELLFKQILDKNIYNLIQTMKSIMETNDNIARMIVNIATTGFDMLNKKRQLPFLICDISRTHPEFLAPYNELLDKFFYENMENHYAFLRQRFNNCTYSIKDIYRTIVTLCTTPFLALHFIENVMGFTKDRIESYLDNCRTEMIRILETRYPTEE